jgi:3-polyprenyl-4-hydroxybenzoate decarboxylase
MRREMYMRFWQELRQFPHGWRANLHPTGTAHSIVVASAWEPTPWGAAQQAGWRALSVEHQHDAEQ